MKKKGKFVFVVYNKDKSDSGLNHFKHAMKENLVLKEEPLPEGLVERVENEEQVKLTPKVYAIEGLYEQYGNSALEHDKSIFIDADMPPEMRKLAIYHELKEIAGKEKGLDYNAAHANARKGEINYAQDMGLTLKENPTKYELDYAKHMMSAENYKEQYLRKRLMRVVDERDKLLRSAKREAKHGKPFKVHHLNKVWEEMEGPEKKIQLQVEELEKKKKKR